MDKITIKVAGHIVENNVLKDIYAIVKGTECDVTDVEMFFPTLKGGWEKQCPSVIKFNLMTLGDDYEPCYQKILGVFLKRDCHLLNVENTGGVK